MVKGEGAPNEGGYEQVFVLRLLMKNIQAVESAAGVSMVGALCLALESLSHPRLSGHVGHKIMHLGVTKANALHSCVCSKVLHLAKPQLWECLLRIQLGLVGLGSSLRALLGSS